MCPAMLQRASEHMDVTTLDNILEFYPAKSSQPALSENIVSQVRMLWCCAMLWKLILKRRLSFYNYYLLYYIVYCIYYYYCYFILLCYYIVTCYLTLL